MSYKTYTTEAIVCGSMHHNTSDKNYLLFSKDAGMVFASARSVREERSKQRCALQDFSLIRVSLVKGKSGWRIGSAESFGNPFLRADTKAARGHVSFLISQLRRYVHGELPLPRAFEDITTLLDMKTYDPDVSLELQNIFLLRLLSELGYVSHDPSWRNVVQAETIFNAHLEYKKEMALSISRAIQAGMEASHL